MSDKSNTSKTNNSTKTPVYKYIIYYSALLAGSAGLVLLDQLSKSWIVEHMQSAENLLSATPGSSITFIPGVIDFAYLGNTGAAWSMFSGGRIFFIILTFLFVIAALIAYGRLSFTKKNAVLHVLIVFMLSGAIGNLIDRINNVIVIDGIEQSYVVDFIKTTFIDFPTFNVADIYVSVSVVVLIIILLFFYKEDKTEEKVHKDTASDEIETYVIHKNENNESVIIRDDSSKSSNDDAL